MTRKFIFKHLWELLIIEALILIYVYFHNIEGARRRELSLLMMKENQLRNRVFYLKMKKEKLLSIPNLENYAKKKGLVPIDPQQVEALVFSKGKWHWRGK